MKAPYFFLFGTLLFAFSSCAQTKTPVVRKYAYFMVNIPGNLPVGEDGRPLTSGFDTSRMVYLETTSAPVAWERVWKKGVPQSFRVDSLPKNVHAAGYDKRTMKPVVIKAAKGYRLWQIVLGGPMKNAEISSAGPAGLLVLQGRAGGKPITVVINEAQELSRPEPVQ